jgi:hypothetical protein
MTNSSVSGYVSREKAPVTNNRGKVLDQMLLSILQTEHPEGYPPGRTIVYKSGIGT